MPIEMSIPTPVARKIAKALKDDTNEDVADWLIQLEAELEEATPKAPWRKVVNTHFTPMAYWEDLECGHSISQTGNIIKDAKRRRCKQCLEEGRT